MARILYEDTFNITSTINNKYELAGVKEIGGTLQLFIQQGD